jgi:ASC-1-like (ASCH) protein
VLQGSEIVVQVAKEALAKFESLDEAKRELLLKDLPSATPYHPISNDYVRHLTTNEAFRVQKFVVQKEVEKVGLSLRCAPGAEISLQAKNSVLRIEGEGIVFKKLIIDDPKGTTSATLSCPKAIFEEYNFGDHTVVSGKLDGSKFVKGRNASDMVATSLKEIEVPVPGFAKSWKGTKFSFHLISETLFKSDVVKKYGDYDVFKKLLNDKSFENVYGDRKAVSSMLRSMGISGGPERDATPEIVKALPNSGSEGTTFSFIEVTLPQVNTSDAKSPGALLLLLPSSPTAPAGIVGRFQSEDQPGVSFYKSISQDPDASYQKMIADLIEFYRLDEDKRVKPVKELDEAALASASSSAKKKDDAPPSGPAAKRGLTDVHIVGEEDPKTTS